MQPQRQTMQPELFSSIPTHNYLGFMDEESRFIHKRVVDFLGFNQNDVAKATGVNKTSVRYDARIPEELAQRLTEIGIICELVAGYFKGDVQKTNLWLSTPNTLLGNMSPKEMIRFSRYRKLHRFIANALAGNHP
jgi:hypothetical protein